MTRPRHEPRGRPVAATAAVLLALVLTGLGVVVALDAVLSGSGRQESVLRRTLVSLDGRAASTATSAVGVVLVLLGLLLVGAALAPRRRTHLRVRSDADVWVTPRATAALAVRCAERQPGVLEARAERSDRRRVTVGAVPRVPDDTSSLSSAQDAVRAELAGLGTTIEIRSREES